MSLDANNYPVNIDVPENVAETFKLESFLKTYGEGTVKSNSLRASNRRFSPGFDSGL
jgi:hypothetical protein